MEAMVGWWRQGWVIGYVHILQGYLLQKARFGWGKNSCQLLLRRQVDILRRLR
jgi:hypothetical protein